MGKIKLLLMVLMAVSFNPEWHAIGKEYETFFPINANMEETVAGIFTVKNCNEKRPWGIVFTPEPMDLAGGVIYQVDLKGTNQVYLKVQETNAMGRFVKEQTLHRMELDSDWQTYTIKAEVNKEKNQIDVMILSDSSGIFHFKNVRVIKK